MTAGRLQAPGGETSGPVLTSEPRCRSPPALPASWCSHTPQRTLTEDPQGQKYVSRSDSGGKIPSRAIRNVQGLPKAVGLPFPRKRQEKKKKIAKILAKINPRVPSVRTGPRLPRSKSAAAGSHTYRLSEWGVASRDLYCSPIGGYTKRRVACTAIG